MITIRTNQYYLNLLSNLRCLGKRRDDHLCIWRLSPSLSLFIYLDRMLILASRNNALTINMLFTLGCLKYIFLTEKSIFQEQSKSNKFKTPVNN